MAIEQPFELAPATYDALVDWPRRLAAEEPFYRRVLAEVGVQRVLDAACGTGRHAALFHSWGLHVQGADAAPAMIDYCRAQHGRDERLDWIVRSFLDPVPPPADYDAVVCVGNSLALVDSLDAFRRSIAALLAALRRGGVCIVQVLNLWRLTEGPVTWQKCKLLPGAEDDRIVLKGLHRVGVRGYVSFVEVSLPRAAPARLVWRHHTTKLLGVQATDVLAAVEAANGQQAELLGTYEGAPYEATQSPDLILVCRRG